MRPDARAMNPDSPGVSAGGTSPPGVQRVRSKIYQPSRFPLAGVDGDAAGLAEALGEEAAEALVALNNSTPPEIKRAKKSQALPQGCMRGQGHRAIGAEGCGHRALEAALENSTGGKARGGGVSEGCVWREGVRTATAAMAARAQPRRAVTAAGMAAMAQPHRLLSLLVLCALAPVAVAWAPSPLLLTRCPTPPPRAATSTNPHGGRRGTARAGTVEMASGESGKGRKGAFRAAGFAVVLGSTLFGLSSAPGVVLQVAVTPFSEEESVFVCRGS